MPMEPIAVGDNNWPHPRGADCRPVVTDWHQAVSSPRRMSQEQESRAFAGLSYMRRRGLEPPPGYPGPGPQEDLRGVRCVRLALERRFRPAEWSHRPCRT